VAIFNTRYNLFKKCLIKNNETNDEYAYKRSEKRINTNHLSSNEYIIFGYGLIQILIEAAMVSRGRTSFIMQFGLSSGTNTIDASRKSRHFDIKTIKASRRRQKNYQLN
jgi:hypothetical protein